MVNSYRLGNLYGPFVSLYFWFSAPIMGFFQLCHERTDLPRHGVVPQAPIGTANVAPAPTTTHPSAARIPHWRKATTIRPAQIPLIFPHLSLLSQLLFLNFLLFLF